jgi:hypothetical protein
MFGACLHVAGNNDADRVFPGGNGAVTVLIERPVGPGVLAFLVQIALHGAGFTGHGRQVVVVVSAPKHIVRGAIRFAFAGTRLARSLSLSATARSAPAATPAAFARSLAFLALRPLLGLFTAQARIELLIQLAARQFVTGRLVARIVFTRAIVA